MRYPIRVWFCCVAGAVALLTILPGCHRAHESGKRYPLMGQILSVGGTRFDGRRELSVRHGDIPGFMPAMSMAYSVKTPTLVERLTPGDLITATLVVEGTDVYLEAIVRTGHADLPPDARPVTAMNVMDAGETVPDTPLTDQEGRTRRLSDWRGRALAVTFVYTRCPVPDFCPLMDRH